MFPSLSDNPTIARFIHKYKAHLFHLWCEKFFRWLFFSLPGFFRVILHWGRDRLLFAELKSLRTIYDDVYSTKTYVLQVVGRGLFPNTGAFIDARGSIKILLPIILIGASLLSIASYYFYQRTSTQTIIPIHSSAQSIKGFPWDLQLLSRPPKVKWIDKTGKIKSLYYEGLPYQGKKPDVFAIMQHLVPLKGMYQKIRICRASLLFTVAINLIAAQLQNSGHNEVMPHYPWTWTGMEQIMKG